MRTERGKGNAGRKLVWGTLAGLFLAGLVSPALGIRTNEVELGRDSVYDGTVKIARNEGGALVFQDNELTSPVKLSALGGSATQHGTLTGLSADDHPQYLNPARHLSGHHAGYNAALPVPPDIHGNATLGAHVSDPDIHPNRAQNVEITGNWRFCGVPDIWNGICFSHGGVAGDIALDFQPGESPAQMLWSQPENRFRLNRGLLVNGQVTLPPMDSAGFVKNGADGLLSGGNTVHLDSPDVTGVLPASHVATDLTVSSSGLVDAGAVKSGTLSNDRFSAFSDLWSENKVGSTDEQVARGNHVHNQYPADYVDKWLVTSQTMQGALVLPSLNVGEATNAGNGEIKIQHAQDAPRVTTVYMAPQNQTQGPHLVSVVYPSDHWYDEDNILHDNDADAATYTTGAWPRQHLYVYNAGFTNLDGVTFTGIEVTLRAKSDRAGDANALFVNCAHGSQKLGNAKEQTVGTTFAMHTLGGSSDLWGMTQWEAQTYIPASASFGLELDSSLYASGDKVWVDWIKIRIYYTENSAARTWSAGTRSAEGDYAIGQSNDLSTSVVLRLSRATRLPRFPAMTTAGFLENDASGNVTGGNNAALADGSVLTTQHYHSALAAPDGSPNPALSVNTTGNVGIGTTAPAGVLNLAGGAADTLAYNDTYSDTAANLSAWCQRRSHSDTVGTLVATIDTESIGRLGFQGTATGGGTPAFGYGAAIIASQDGAAGTSYVPTNLTLSTYSGTAQNANQMVLHNDGKVGIGTAAPAGTLDILSGSDYGQLLLTRSKSTTTQRNGISAQHYTSTEEPLALISAYESDTESRVFVGGGPSVFNAATSIEFYTAANNTTPTGTEKMRINSTGVGIGTTPTGALDVVGTVKATTSLVSTGGLIEDTDAEDCVLRTNSNANQLVLDSAGYIGIGTAAPLGTFDTQAATGWYAADGSKPVWMMSYAATPVMKFYFGPSWDGYLDVPYASSTDASGGFHIKCAGTEILTVHKSGKVGVNTATPTKAFHVTGDIIASSSISTSGTLTFGDTGGSGSLVQGSTTRIDTSGNATLGTVTAGNMTSGTYNVPRGRGIGTTLPSSDLRDWDMFFKSDENSLYIYVSGSWRAAAPPVP